MIARYTAQRAAQLIPTVLVISFLVFFLIHLIPGDPVRVVLGYGGDDASAPIPRELYEQTRRELGLDQPIPVQYLNWLGGVIRGDLGRSLATNEPVLSIILNRLPATLYLASAAFILAMVIAVPAGILSAVRQNTLPDYVSSVLAIIGMALPNFWFALLLILFFSINLRWFPTIGYVPPNENFGKFLQHITLPTIVLGTATAAAVTRFMRAEFLEQLNQDYVRTAVAKGLPRRLVLWKHTLKNSLIVTATAMGFQIAHLLGGSTIVETVFSYPGVSYLLLQSIYARDFPTVQGVVLFIALIVVAVNFLVDILYTVLDPRIRFD